MPKQLTQLSRVYLSGFGAYVPAKRVSVEVVASSQRREPESVKSGLGIVSKAQAQADEDALTLGWEAAFTAFSSSGFDRKKIQAVYVGSESHPYAVKPTATLLASTLGLPTSLMAADLEFACKAGTTAVQLLASQIEAGAIQSGLAVGCGVSQAKPGDMLEFTAGAGAAALILSDQPKQAVAQLQFIDSYTTDTPDFWRRQHQVYPSHGGRFTGEPGYFHHVVTAAEQFLKKNQMQMSEFDHVVFHMPNGKFPKRAAQVLKVTEAQLKAGFVVETIGNPYSAASLIGFCRVLEVAHVGDQILVVSYGSGAGSDCLSWEKL